MSKETKRFFLDVLADLRVKCDSKSNYNYVKAAGLLRQLLLDDPPLMDLINKEYKDKIVFGVRKQYPSPLNQHVGKDGVTYTTIIAVSFLNPGADKKYVDYLKRDKFLKHRIFNFGGRDITVLEILKLNANKKGGIHLDNKPNKNTKELLIDIANTTVNYTGEITGGAYAVKEIGNITLKALKNLEDKVKADLEQN